MGGEQRGAGRGAVAADPDRTAALSCQQQRFVAKVRSLAALAHGTGRCATATMAAADNARLQAAPGELLRQRDNKRRLAAAPDREVADNDHRHRETAAGKNAEAVGAAAQRDQQAKQQADGVERERDGVAPAPVARDHGGYAGGCGHRRRGLICRSGWRKKSGRNRPAAPPASR